MDAVRKKDVISLAIGVTINKRCPLRRADRVHSIQREIPG